MDNLSEAKTSRGGLVTLRTVLRLRLLFGFYSNISGNASLAFFFRIYCFLMLYGMLDAFFRHIYDFSFTPLHISYFATSFVGFVTGENHFFKFCGVIEEIDKEMGLDHLPFVTPTIQWIFILLCVYKSISVTIYILQCISLGVLSKIYMSQHILFNVSNTAVAFCIFTIITSLDMLQSRLKLLRKILNYNLTRIDWNSNSRIKSTYDCVKLYKTLTDSLNASFPWMKLQIVVQFVGSFAAFIFHSQSSIRDIIHGTLGIMDFFTMYIQIFVSCMTVCLMPLFGELVTREVDNLKKAFGNRLLECEDEEVRTALDTAGQYLQERPFKITFFRVCTLDGSLILTFVGLCFTYLVTTIQFTVAI